MLIYSPMPYYKLVLFSYQWMIKRMIKRWSEVIGAALICNRFSPIPLKFKITMKTKSMFSDLSLSKIYKSLNPSNSWTKSVSLEWQHFSLKLAYCCQQSLPQTRKHLCLCLRVWPAQAGLECRSKGSATNFAVKACPCLSCLLEYPSGH